MAWLRLRTVHTQIAAAKARLKRLQDEKRLVRLANAAALRVGRPSAELRMDSVAALEFEEQRIAQLLEHLAQQRRVAEREFMKCRREREIVENAIALEKAAYEEERARREQAALDDETLQRLTRNREYESTLP